jgi:hypothetical protein
MPIPPYQWRRLTINERRIVVFLINSFQQINNTTASFTKSLSLFHPLWYSHPPIFIGFFTGVFSLALLLIMPLHPVAMPVAFGGGISLTVILCSIRFLFSGESRMRIYSSGNICTVGVSAGMFPFRFHTITAEQKRSLQQKIGRGTRFRKR